MQQEQSLYSKRRLTVLGVLVILVLIIVFLVWWWFVPKKPIVTQTGTPAITESDRVVLPKQTQVLETPSARPAVADQGEAQILSLARNFAERYGSWSTDSGFQNLNDLAPYSTARLRAEFEDTIAATETPTLFKGSETVVLKMDIQSRTASAAGVLVTTQRIETDSQLKQTVTYHDLLVFMVKQGEFWYVDRAEWKN
ncbi:MAG: hypothetical protein HY422_03340 [Candidatus Komeilibacteria bacterium]|nr:hypothetical protein [Candidatus Komeilibacteria bacterium]